MARILTGDPSAMDVTDEQKMAAKSLQQELDMRHHNEFVQKRNLGENMVYQEGLREKYLELEERVSEAMKDFKSSL